MGSALLEAVAPVSQAPRPKILQPRWTKDSRRKGLKLQKKQKNTHTTPPQDDKDDTGFIEPKVEPELDPGSVSATPPVLDVPMQVLSYSEDETKAGVGVQELAAEPAPSAPMDTGLPAREPAEDDSQRSNTEASHARAKAKTKTKSTEPSSANIHMSEESSVPMDTEGLPAREPAADDSQRSNTAASSARAPAKTKTKSIPDPDPGNHPVQGPKLLLFHRRKVLSGLQYSIQGLSGWTASHLSSGVTRKDLCLDLILLITNCLHFAQIMQS